MKGTIEIEDKELENFISSSLDKKLSEIDIDQKIDSKINQRVDKIIKESISNEKVLNLVRDRISRVITTESIKDYSQGVDNADVLSNLEQKVLLMIANSKDFEKLVIKVLKSRL